MRPYRSPSMEDTHPPWPWPFPLTHTSLIITQGSTNKQRNDALHDLHSTKDPFREPKCSFKYNTFSYSATFSLLDSYPITSIRKRKTEERRRCAVHWIYIPSSMSKHRRTASWVFGSPCLKSYQKCLSASVTVSVCVCCVCLCVVASTIIISNDFLEFLEVITIPIWYRLKSLFHCGYDDTFHSIPSLSQCSREELCFTFQRRNQSKSSKSV